MEKCKLLIREAIKACEEAGGQLAIAEAAYDSDGGLDQAHIFCAACDGIESFEVQQAVRAAALSKASCTKPSAFSQCRSKFVEVLTQGCGEIAARQLHRVCWCMHCVCVQKMNPSRKRRQETLKSKLY